MIWQWDFNNPPSRALLGVMYVFGFTINNSNCIEELHEQESGYQQKNMSFRELMYNSIIVVSVGDVNDQG